MTHALLDTNVFFSEGLRSLILHLFEFNGTYYPHWSDHVLGEWRATHRNKSGNTKGKNADILTKNQKEIWPDAYLKISDKSSETTLWDQADSKIAQSAIQGKCEWIITYNIKDFPNSKLRKYGLRPIHPEKLLLDFLEKEETMALLHTFVQARFNSKMELFLTYLKKIALNKFAAAIERRL
ncbi:MAG TPA: PIN domain-containing protein [Saprospiraceae bacterium]|nr:PIN domain-containing protein [Saprospiraceae bacterium]HPN72227.1 PIN domain-containing protein [Saprospiraceae bacterium]